MTLTDRRHFRRCPRETDIVLKFKNKYFKAKMINYSPGGIGAVIENITALGKGDSVEIKVENADIKTPGEIVWSMIDKSTLRLGVRNAGKMEGMTQDYELADILTGFHRGGKTGVLTIHSGGNIAKKIYIKNGDMIFSASNQDEDRLGDILLRQGRINSDQYHQSVIEMKRTGQRQGTALVKLGYLAPGELVSVVQHQVEHIIKSLFVLEDARFEFEERSLPSDEVITLRLSAANLIYRGVKQINSVGRIQKKLPSLDGVLYITADPLYLFQDLRLDETGLKIISHIDGRRSAEDIISAAQLDRFEALKTIYALLSVRSIGLYEDRASAVGMPEEITLEMRGGKEEIRSEAEFKELIEEMHHKCGRLGHYDVLGIREHASIAEIKSAYYRAAKMYHPDMHFHHADETLKDKLSDIFSYVYEAYSTLSDPQKRKIYDKVTTAIPVKPSTIKDKAGTAFEEGKIQLKKNNYKDAALLFGQAAYFDSTVAEYHYLYGLTQTRLNNFRGAEKAFERARRLQPLNANYLAELGFVHIELGHPARAKGLFEKALGISPGNGRAAEGLKKIKDA